MTVKELIKELEKMNQDLPVCIVTHGAFVGTRVENVKSIVKCDSHNWKKNSRYIL